MTRRNKRCSSLGSSQRKGLRLGWLRRDRQQRVGVVEEVQPRAAAVLFQETSERAGVLAVVQQGLV